MVRKKHTNNISLLSDVKNISPQQNEAVSVQLSAAAEKDLLLHLLLIADS
jgi:hypothetical protein